MTWVPYSYLNNHHFPTNLGRDRTTQLFGLFLSLFKFIFLGMQPSGNFTIPESPPPGYMSEDSEYNETASSLSSPGPSAAFSGKNIYPVFVSNSFLCNGSRII